MLRNDKVKLFTHNDLDGIGCYVLLKSALDKDTHIDVEYCDYDNINERVTRLFKDTEKKSQYDLILITDISVNEQVAELSNDSIKMSDPHQFPTRVVLLDHHATALSLNKYDWANVVVVDEETDIKQSGTSLLFDFIAMTLSRPELFQRHSSFQNMFRFVDLVTQYDTWVWETNDNQQARELNDLLYLLGQDEFIEVMLMKIKGEDTDNFVGDHRMLLDLEQVKIDRYIKSKGKSIIEVEIEGYKAGVVFAEQYTSVIGNALSKLNPHLDFIAVVDMDRGVSYRTTKDGIALGLNVASKFGGGGHDKASGSSIYDSKRQCVINNIFSLSNSIDLEFDMTGRVYDYYKNKVGDNRGISFEMALKKLNRNIKLGTKMAKREGDAEGNTFYMYGCLKMLVVDNTIVHLFNSEKAGKDSLTKS